MRRTDVEIGTAAVLMKRAPAHQGGADAPQLDAVAGHQLGKGMLASKSLGVDDHVGVG
jgi:hypothetical protein